MYLVKQHRILRQMSESSLNKYGHRRKIHLYHQPRTTKGRGRIEYYSLATCYFEGGKNKKRILQTLGELTAAQADQYRFLLKAINGQIDAGQIVDIDAVVYRGERQYLDVLAMDTLWTNLGLKAVFDRSLSTNQKLSTENVARILTINRLLCPAAKSRTVDWFAGTLLANIMEIDPTGYERSKVFRELEEIHKAKPHIEKLFFEFSQKSPAKYEAYYFDGSTSWFEGSKCPLAEYDLEKTRGFFPKVVGLMLLTDNQGYPIAWEAVNGHTKDNKALKAFVDRIARDYKIKDITYCFDRGVASQDNFDLIAEAEGKYISAIRDNQIKDVFDLDRFKDVRIKITDKICDYDKAEEEIASPKRRIIGIDGFHASDNNIFFKDLGIIGDKRYVVSFSYELFIKETLGRQKSLLLALEDILKKNADLESAKRDRDYNATERDLLDIFSKHQVRAFINYSLKPLITKTKKQSFEIDVTLDQEAIDRTALSDGILVYVTNHIKKTDKKNFDLSAHDIVAHYKGKYVVENAFRELKSFLELRPFYVWTEEHVKAHYDVGIMACFINNYISQKIAQLDKSLRDFHTHLPKAGRIAQLATPSGLDIFKLKEVNQETQAYFECLGIKEILSPLLHRRHNVFR